MNGEKTPFVEDFCLERLRARPHNKIIGYDSSPWLMPEVFNLFVSGITLAHNFFLIRLARN